MIYHTTISHTNSNVYLSQEERNKMQKRIRIEHTKEEQRKKLKNIEWKNEMYSSCAVVSARPVYLFYYIAHDFSVAILYKRVHHSLTCVQNGNKMIGYTH